ncbi:PD-(D/E)XK nuclease family protein [Leisingera aquaemixtae]|uniref:PD-(D/E)XK nuclease family protein n=1 Tax=Leisingera aquaemixtae TaxID=1396826 RepID=A0ABY5WEM9_9RHOB|nr:PD-(D/E)XK nuclease family protein [Leisingera aquaemixtae]UWQ39918.1 PD-(D/E)XK nuclease family protein [Leisingera aquaemixtae]
MFFPFEVVDPRTGVASFLAAENLAEASLAPRAAEWAPSRTIRAIEDPVWAESLANAPLETCAAISSALENLILACPDLKPPRLDAMPEGRAKRHLKALVDLWEALEPALPEGGAAIRHVLALPHGRFLERLPVVEGSLATGAPAAVRALYERLRAEFGSVAKPQTPRLASPGSRLYALQAGLSSAGLERGAQDESVAFFGLRDPALCADFAAARARSLIEAGCPAREIAVMTAGNPHHLARAFLSQGVPLSGVQAAIAERDVISETLYLLLVAKRRPAPPMALASLALSPLMPWAEQTACDLSESVMGGERRGAELDSTPAHKALWDDIRAPAESLPQLRLLMERILAALEQAEVIKERFAPLRALLSGDGAPDWEFILRNVSTHSVAEGPVLRALEGVSLWSAQQTPWRPCRHLIVTDFTEGFYPERPRANPLFLDSEITLIREVTGIGLCGRVEGLARALDRLDLQLQAVSGSVTFLVPWRDLAGARQAPAAGLSLVARALAGLDEPAEAIVDLARVPPSDWPVAHHVLPDLPVALPLPEALSFGRRCDLLALREDETGLAKPQSPSRLETLIVSPLSWLLGELEAGDMSWAPEELDVLAKGNLAHDVFEHVFVPEVELPTGAALVRAVREAYQKALRRSAAFLLDDAWEMERNGLEREIQSAAEQWRTYIDELGATVVGNELWLHGSAYGISLRGKCDAILELPDGAILIVDHKKSGTKGRRLRMERGWDLQAGLYRDMIARPTRSEGDAMERLQGRTIGVAYHLMNDGGLLTSGISLPEGSPARDMGEEVNAGAIEALRTRLAEVAGGRVVLNTSTDVSFFRKEAGFTPYALTDGSPLVLAFMRDVEE